MLTCHQSIKPKHVLIARENKRKLEAYTEMDRATPHSGFPVREYARTLLKYGEIEAEKDAWYYTVAGMWMIERYRDWHHGPLIRQMVGTAKARTGSG